MARIFIKIITLAFITFSSWCEAAPTLDFQASMIGLDAFPDIESSAKKLSQLLNPDSDFTLNSDGILRDILQEDIRRIAAYLKSCGFYAARVYPEVEITNELKYIVNIHIEPGERYIVNRIEIFLNDHDFVMDPDLLSTQKEAPVLNEYILNDKNKIAHYLKQNGHAFVEIMDEVVEINHDALLANVRYAFKTKGKGKFGSHTLSGLKTVDATYVEKFIQWKTGELYNADLVTRTEQLLMDTGLFESVLITPLDPNSAKEFNLAVKLTEGKHHHLQFTVYGNVAISNTTADRYEIGMVPKYVHDNLAGANEKLEITPILSNILQDLNISLRKPHLWFFDTAGRVFLSGERRTYEAYSRWGMDVGFGLEYKVTDAISLDISSIYERYSLERQTDLKKQLYGFVGFPLSLNIDTREDKIFSQSGIACVLNWTPYLNTESTIHQFSIQSKFYLPVVQEHFILAGWAQWNTLSGTSFEDSPMDKRIFLGGGQSLRGYDTHILGNTQPLNKDPKKLIPIGGLSSISAGIEPRIALYHPLWIALFCDAGFISQSSNIFKEFDNLSNLYWDVGFSVFYFTSFGPLRADIAYPCGKEPADGKKEVKFYISFGQAF